MWMNNIIMAYPCHASCRPGWGYVGRSISPLGRAVFDARWTWAGFASDMRAGYSLALAFFFCSFPLPSLILLHLYLLLD